MSFSFQTEDEANTFLLKNIQIIDKKIASPSSKLDNVFFQEIDNLFQQTDKVISLPSISSELKLKLDQLKEKFDILKYENRILSQYDTTEKMDFYSTLMGDGTDSIHFGLWNHIDISQEGAYGKASTQMTEWMWKQVQKVTPPLFSLKNSYYVDLGSGTGASSRHLCSLFPSIRVQCVNLCPNQNHLNVQKNKDQHLHSRIDVHTGSYNQLPCEWSNKFEGCFSQDAFVHSFCKKKTFSEAFRVTQNGGWFVFSDLMCNHPSDKVKKDLSSFSQTNVVNDWKSPEETMSLLSEVGWVKTNFIDLTSHLQKSFENMLLRVNQMLNSKDDIPLNRKFLEIYQTNLSRRIEELVHSGKFKWGVIVCQKPAHVLFLSSPPVQPKFDPSIQFSILPTNKKKLENGNLILEEGANALAITVLDKMSSSCIKNLPYSVKVIISMSSGLDHIDLNACSKRGIRVLRAGRKPIIKGVSTYAISLIILGLRKGFQQIGVPFNKQNWSLSWNSEGVSMEEATIGFIGIGPIASETIRQLRSLSQQTRIVYWVSSQYRKKDIEEKYNVTYCKDLNSLLPLCDMVIPLCPLNKSTEKLLSYKELSLMKKDSILLNLSRGKIVVTDDLVKILQENKIASAILDVTFPEPLPSNHPLNHMDNVVIFPHYATNTRYVRRQLVEDVELIFQQFLSGKIETIKIENQLRKDLSCAYKATHHYKMDELVWNHISARLPSNNQQPPQFLLTPGRRMFNEINPEDIVKNSSNVTAHVIHEAIYQARLDVQAIVHLHTPATVAVSCLKSGFIPFAQESAYFYKKVAYLQYRGLSDDVAEQKHIQEAVQGNINVLIMQNHGFCTLGSSIAEAWVLAYYFDKSCQTQLSLLQTGQELIIPSEESMKKASEQSFLPQFLPGECEWEAIYRYFNKKQ